ncbi:MAG: hypothetical protein V7K50_03025 [Nostoc sp.]|uniref:beta strand repeat-containing protein n=1 Tax=Nostoc sp. TaxID=1180 RepID=UPI002FFB5D1F
MKCLFKNLKAIAIPGKGDRGQSNQLLGSYRIWHRLVLQGILTTIFAGQKNIDRTKRSITVRNISKSRGMLNKLWMPILLSGGTALSYLLLTTLAPTKTFAGELEFSSGSMSPIPNGPTTNPLTATLLENTTGTTFAPYTPAITVTGSFSNQTYTNGLTFGATINAASKTPVAQPVFDKMSVIGTPTNSMFTSNPSSTAGTGISTTDNYAFSMFATTEPLDQANLATNGRYYYGDLTLTFSRPLSDPVIQIVGLGGTNGTHGHSAEFELVTPGITASKLSGTTELNVTNNKILNSATTVAATCGSGAACGSVKFAGTNIKTLTFKVYLRGDNAAGTWSAAGNYNGDKFLFGGVSIAKPVTVSGTVFDDANGLTNNAIGGTGSNAGGLFANLVDGNGNVVASTAVAANGTYSFLAIGAGSYSVSISTTAGVQGSTAPAASIPSGWVNTGEGTAAAGDGTVNGTTSITVAAVDVTGVNFGIEQPPNTTDVTASSQTNPGSTTKVQVATLAGTDSEDGALGSGKSFKIVTLPTNGTLTYNNVAVTTGQVISNYDPTLLKLDPNDGAITVSFTYAAVDSAGQVDPTSASVTMPFSVPSFVTVTGTVFSDADADVTINGSDAGTNAGSANLTIYAIDTAGKVVAKATVAANGTYTLTNVPQNSSLTLRLSNDSTVAIGATAPTAPSIPSGWYYTGENLNGTIDPVITTLGDIALTTTTSNLTNENFGIRQAYSIAADIAPIICNPDYRTALNTGITAAGGQVATGANDLNWTAEWIAGPASGPGTPYAPPRPVGVMPAVVVGNLAPGAWINEPANARWISYPFRLSVNSNGVHNDADLDGINGEGNSGFSGPGTSDDVRLKFTSQLTLPSNANTIAISLPVGVAIDNQFVSIKVNGVENLVPTPAANPIAADYGTLKSVNITNGWQAGVNTIEVIVDSGPDRVGFFLGVQATTTQVCTNPNVLLVKRITAINGGTTTFGGDSLVGYIDSPTNAYDDNTITIPTQPTPTDPPKDTDKWPSLNSFMLGGINGGKVKPSDEIEYTVYFLSAGNGTANNVLICDRIPDNATFMPTAFNSFPTKNTTGLPSGDRGIIWQNNGVTESLTNAKDDDTAEYLSPDIDPTTKYPDIKCDGSNTNGVVVVNLGNVPNATAPGTPINSYGFIRFRARIK